MRKNTITEHFIKELEFVIKNLSFQKSPSPNYYTSEFYKTLKKDKNLQIQDPLKQVKLKGNHAQTHYNQIAKNQRYSVEKSWRKSKYMGKQRFGNDHGFFMTKHGKQSQWKNHFKNMERNVAQKPMN